MKSLFTVGIIGGLKITRLCPGFFLLILLCAPAQAQKLTRGPYLQVITPESAVVRWRTDKPATNYVRYGEAASKLSSEAFSQGLLTEHAVMISGLKANTRYYYAVGLPDKILAGGRDFFFVTAPPAGTAQPIRVWVLGDSGTRTSNQKAVRDTYYNATGARHTDAILMLGDNAYAYGTDHEYQGAVFEMYSAILRNTALWPTLGNHDARSCNSATLTGVYYGIFTMPTLGEAGGVLSGTKAYYSFEIGNAHFICVDSQDTERSIRPRMLKWLAKDLSENRCTWTFAYCHHPPYSKGSHDSDKADEESGGRLLEMREQILPVLEKGGVDVVMCGHSHDYERSFLLDGHYGNSSTFGDQFKKDGGDGREEGQGAYHKPTLGPAPHEGTVYVVAGCSGKISGGKLNHRAMVTSLNELGSLILDINTNRLDVSFLNWKGVARDHFTMIKGQGK